MMTLKHSGLGNVQERISTRRYESELPALLMNTVSESKLEPDAALGTFSRVLVTATCACSHD